MHALARHGVQINRQRRHQGLALAGLHFGNFTLVQHQAAHQLDVEMALAEGPLRRLAHRREGLRQQIVQVLAVFQAFAKRRRALLQCLVAEGFQLRLEGIDALDGLFQTLDRAVVHGTENFSEHRTLKPAGNICAIQHRHLGATTDGFNAQRVATCAEFRR